MKQETKIYTRKVNKKQKKTSTASLRMGKIPQNQTVAVVGGTAVFPPEHKGQCVFNAAFLNFIWSIYTLKVTGFTSLKF